MNCPYCEISSLTSDGQERIACCDKCGREWIAGGSGVLHRDNLIYLPFAAHLSEEDAAQEQKAA